MLLLLRPYCTAQQLRGLQRVGQTLFRRFFSPLQAKANVCHPSPVDGPSPKHSRVFHFPVGVCRLVFHRLKITSLVNWNKENLSFESEANLQFFADIIKKVKIFCNKILFYSDLAKRFMFLMQKCFAVMLNYTNVSQKKSLLHTKLLIFVVSDLQIYPICKSDVRFAYLKNNAKGVPLENEIKKKIFFYFWDFWPLLVHPMKIFHPLFAKSLFKSVIRKSDKYANRLQHIFK